MVNELRNVLTLPAVERKIDQDASREGGTLTFGGVRIAELGRCSRCPGRLYTARERDLGICVDCGAFNPSSGYVAPEAA